MCGITVKNRMNERLSLSLIITKKYFSVYESNVHAFKMNSLQLVPV